MPPPPDIPTTLHFDDPNKEFYHDWDPLRLDPYCEACIGLVSCECPP